MKNFRLLLFMLAGVFLLYCCNNESDPIEENNIVQPVVEKTVSGSAGSTTAGNPNRPYYDIVIMDVDRWEICLNVSRVRRNVTSYSGHLWYQMGAFIFEGHATAMYNPHLDLLTVTALDSGWDRGHICYSLKFKENSNDMEGTFVYREYPRRTNAIDAWLIQGILGSHIAGSSTTTQTATNKIPSVHLKKESTKLQND